MLDSSVEWLMSLDTGKKRMDSRHILRLSQAVASMFSNDQWSEIQQQLLKDSGL